MQDAEQKRYFALGYLWCLRVLRTLRKERGLPWPKAIIETGKMLTSLVADQWPGSELEGLSVKGIEYEHGG